MDREEYSLTPQISQRRLTARNLADFVLCPQRCLLSFFTTRAQERRFIGGPAALHRALRSTLVETYRSGGPPQVSEAALLPLFEPSWEGELCADSLEEERLHSEGVAMLQAYHQMHKDEPNQAIASDLRLTGELDGYSFVAVADRVDRADDGTVTLLRYNSSRRPPSPGQLAEDLSAGLLLLLGQTHFRDSVCRTAVYALRPGRLVVAAIGCSQLATLRDRLVNIAEAVRGAQQFPTDVGRHCRWCRSRAQCPAWAEAHYQPTEDD